MQRVDEDPGVGPIDGCDDSCRGAEVADLHPRRELEVDGQPEVAGEVTQASEAVDGPVPIGIGQLADDVAGADRRRRLEQPEVVVGLVVRSEPGELDVEDADAGVGEARGLDRSSPIPDQRDDVLTRGHRVVRMLA